MMQPGTNRFQEEEKQLDRIRRGRTVGRMKRLWPLSIYLYKTESMQLEGEQGEKDIDGVGC
jgi:hypothetical protein